MENAGKEQGFRDLYKDTSNYVVTQDKTMYIQLLSTCITIHLY